MVLVLSLAYAEAQERSLREKLRQAQQELLERFLPRKYRQVWKGDKMADTKALSPVQMVEYYRQEYRIEQQFHKLLTKTTDLLPINLKNETRIIALLRLVMLALQFVTLIQYSIRKNSKTI